MSPDDPLEIPECLRVDPTEQKRRNAEGKNKRLRWTRDMNFKEGPKVLDPGTVKLLEERNAADRAVAAKKKADAKEARLIRARRKTKPPGDEPITAGDDTMKKTAKKQARKTNRPGAKVSHRAIAKATTKAAQASARTPASTGRKSEVTAMMRRPEGVTTAQIHKVTGMLEHSARALISGIAKDLPPTEAVLKSKDGAKATVYRIGPKS